jgi:isopentenyl diphosphate isomerase/L-lactate dehydrogenase-like FMN-dependent dehydrogenase
VPAFEYRLRPPGQIVNVEDYRRAARRRLPSMVWEYVDSGADDLETMRDNRDGFGRWSLRNRVLAGHEHRELATTVAGIPLASPILLAPTGLTGLTQWDGDIAAVRAAERCGTRYMLSTMSSWSIEEVASVSTSPHIFQLYPKEGDIAGGLMRRAAAAGFEVMVVTVDVPVLGNRESADRAGMSAPPVMTPERIAKALRHPRWVYDLYRHQRVATANIAQRGGLTGAVESVERSHRELIQSRLDWDDLAWVRDQWPGPLLVKGILDPEDAKRALALGINGLVVSNHGGRQLDFAQGSLDALPAIVEAVGDRMEVLLDGGVRRGTDIVKALALGARAVLIGRPYLYGLAVDGEEGVVRVLDILRTELERAMTLMGVGSIHELDATWLIRREGGV